MKRRFSIIFALLLLLYAATAFAAHNEGPGLVQAPLITQTFERIGVVSVWNTGDKFQLRLDGVDDWQLKTFHIYVGNDPVPATRKGNLIPGRFNYKEPYQNAEGSNVLVLDLETDMGFSWGEPYSDLRVQNIAVHVAGEKFDASGNVIAEAAAWAYTGDGADTEFGDIDEESLSEIELESMGKGWWFSYMLSHPSRGHFIDSPVGGLSFTTPTHSNLTDEAGAFDFFPGESVTLSIGNYLLGTTVADHKISPLDFYPLSDVEDENVTNMARLLQSLDSNAYPKDGITITADVVKAFETAMGNLGYSSLNFDSTEEIDAIIDEAIFQASSLGVDLVEVYPEDAQTHLADTVNNSMFRKNISKTPDLASSKAKMNIMTVWFPAKKANGDPVDADGIVYNDADGNSIDLVGNGTIDPNTHAKPIIVTYTDDDPVTGGADTWAAVSRDDGNTWKRKNLSRSGDLSSFTLANGEPYYGSTKKPVFQVRGNKILVAWSSKYAKGGKPGYAEPEFLGAVDENGDPVLDDEGNPVPSATPNPSYIGEDIWGVGGPQRSHDYTEDGFPEVGEIPFAALWVCRGVIVTANEIKLGGFWADKEIGDIVWFKPERVTSGRRDVNQIFVASAGSAGFAMVWQEDPNGVQPGKAVGPGPGWGGATTSHKTDIWYSYLAWGDFSKIDEDFVPGSEVDHLADIDTDEEWVSNRPKALIPCSLPVRLSDNEVINKDNIRVELNEDGTVKTDADGNYIIIPNDDAISADSDGTHLYALEVPGLLDGGWYGFTNYDEEFKEVAITEDGRLLDGDTGASRGNIFLQPYATGEYDAKGNPVISAWTIITYEETKGAGAGPPEEEGGGEDNTNSDAYIPEEGKNVIYHSFDMFEPDLVSAGRIVNRPEFIDVNENNIIDEGELVYLVDEDGVVIKDYLERPQLAYENARRGRFMPQGIGAFGKTGTALVMVHKQGPDGAGRPSDILLRRWQLPAGATKVPFKNENNAGTVVLGFSIKDVKGNWINPYSPERIVGEWVVDDASGQGYYADGVQNVSSVTPTVTTDSAGDPEQDDAWGAVKVVEWIQTEDNLKDPTGTRRYDESGLVNTTDLTVENPYDDARAHRGSLRGDWVTCGFSYTANWAAARNGHDHYDFYIRRSYDGGQTWTTAPASLGGTGVEHCRTWTYPSGTQEAGTKVEECSTYAAGEYEAMRNLSQLPNHKQSVIEPRIVAVPGTIKAGGVKTGLPEDEQNKSVFYVAYGTSTNPIKDPITGEQEEPAPQDLWWSVSVDMGETYYLREWEVNPDSDGGLADETVYRWDYMAKGDQEQGEVQLRETPDGSRFYASWLDEGEDGSDIVFRRILPPVFEANWADGTVPEGTIGYDGTILDDLLEDDGSSSDAGDGDSGGSLD
ncbi:hypothetical protein SAMN02745165_01994 [Malonomonas rubra DSM 5091]|uniref:BNR repeat-like domain-containing protein n=1 Tax=Malonomonas rubra DSM 5091 TaxID=1122189 RepID=A0A1M6I3G6_MALRU|nr:choice-of-anchor O protein [Malonomonas rubra]SHJ28958.1 hypothetical protein SAMN02745165_01994 [Malonomonas rubra DSM 5091]